MSSTSRLGYYAPIWSGKMRRFVRRYVLWVLIDALIVQAGLYLAWAGRSVTADLDIRPAALFGLLAVCTYCVSNYAFRLYNRMWRYASAGEVLIIVAAAATSTVFLILVDLFWTEPRSLPASVVLLMGLFTFVGFVAVRYQRRVWSGFVWRWRALGGGSPVDSKRVLIVGAGEAGQLLAWRFQNQKEGILHRLVGFVDDDRAKHGMRIHGIPILGDRYAIPQIVADHRVNVIVIAIHNITGNDFRAILDVCESTPAMIKVVPNIFDLIEGVSGQLPIRDVTLEDLLGRKPVEIDHNACRHILAGKTVLVTGAAGSIGAELCRQIVAFEPGLMLMLDNNESGLFSIVQTLALSRGQRQDGQRLKPIVGDVTNEEKMRVVFETFQPEVVFHAAAYKHVPLMEDYPEEAVRVNVLGTYIIVSLAARHGAERFVLVSTDKAISPRSVMGATKRIGEMLAVKSMRDNLKPNAHRSPLFAAVRFGNVLGSRGSVVPTFERQIDLGGPVTVTHPDITRYLMSIPEAASLVIQAATIAQGGDIFMLDMGQRVHIDELARRLIRLRGLRPDVDIPIVYTGLRPGEKMHEDLRGLDEESFPTIHPHIYRIQSKNDPDRLTVLIEISQLIDLAEAQRIGDMLAKLWHIVGPEGRPREFAAGDQSLMSSQQVSSTQLISPQLTK